MLFKNITVNFLFLEIDEEVNVCAVKETSVLDCFKWNAHNTDNDL